MAADPDRPDTLPGSGRPRLTRHVRMSYDRSRDRHVLQRPEAVTVLNPTGAAILELCDGRRTIAEIQEELRGRYDRVVDGEVDSFLRRLVVKRCVEVDDG